MSLTFDSFATTAGPRLRAALVAAYGPDQGADAAAEALAYGWEHWSRVSTMANPTGYLFRVGQTAARRAAPRHGFLPRPTAEELPSFEPGLLPALEALSEPQRIAVVFVHAFGWSQVETAELLAVHPSTVRTHLTRALTKPPWRWNPVSEHDVKEQLAHYGDWLEDSTGLALRPPLPDPDTIIEPKEETVPVAVSSIVRRSRHPRLAMVAAVVVAVVGGVLAIGGDRFRGSDQSVVAASAQDPVGPLYVIPLPEAGFEISNGTVVQGTLPPEQQASHLLVVGIKGTDGFRQLANVQLRPGPELLSGIGTWRDVELATGPALLSDDHFVQLVQERDGASITIWSGEGTGPYAREVMESLRIGSDGLLEVDESSALVVIEGIIGPIDGAQTATSFDLATPTSSDGIAIETATAPSPLLAAGGLGTELRPIRVQGVDGWLIIRDDWNGVA